ncbi:hypothetical protein BC831DRAFT_444822 [Entophlyctis helioformis]|nr:hypothetical protein BC831DRAFT_444822 [Entophlyctis helioformis]
MRVTRSAAASVWMLALACAIAPSVVAQEPSSDEFNPSASLAPSPAPSPLPVAQSVVLATLDARTQTVFDRNKRQTKTKTPKGTKTAKTSSRTARRTPATTKTSPPTVITLTYCTSCITVASLVCHNQSPKDDRCPSCDVDIPKDDRCPASTSAPRKTTAPASTSAPRKTTAAPAVTTKPRTPTSATTAPPAARTTTTTAAAPSPAATSTVPPPPPPSVPTVPRDITDDEILSSILNGPRGQASPPSEAAKPVKRDLVDDGLDAPATAIGSTSTAVAVAPTDLSNADSLLSLFAEHGDFDPAIDLPPFEFSSSLEPIPKPTGTPNPTDVPEPTVTINSPFFNKRHNDDDHHDFETPDGDIGDSTTLAFSTPTWGLNNADSLLVLFAEHNQDSGSNLETPVGEINTTTLNAGSNPTETPTPEPTADSFFVKRDEDGLDAPANAIGRSRCTCHAIGSTSTAVAVAPTEMPTGWLGAINFL